MDLLTIQPMEKWVELENEIIRKSNMDASVFDTKGIRITDNKQWANRLCPAIKATDKGQAFICAVAHMNLAEQAKQTRNPVVEECDAGLIKIVVPIFVEDEFVGAVGACGLLFDDGEVDSFLINKITDIDESEVESLSSDIGTMARERAGKLVTFIEEKIKDHVISASNR